MRDVGGLWNNVVMRFFNTFLRLIDTFNSYTGLAGKYLRVNATETGIEAVDYTNEDWSMTEARNVVAGTADTFTILMKARNAMTITSLVHEVDNGTLTSVAVKIEGVAVTGLSSLSVSTTRTETAATANNIVSAGDEITLEITIGYTGSPTKIMYQLNFDRIK